MTCKRAHDIVRRSVSLQLHIELDINGLEIAGQSSKADASYLAVLNGIKGYRNAWMTSRIDLRFQQHPIHLNVRNSNFDLRNEAYIGAFREPNEGYPDNQLNRIQIIRLNSPIIPPPLDFKKNFDNFMVDVYQDLVVLFEYIKEDPSSVFARVHLHHATSGLPHLLARFPTFAVRVENSWGSPKIDLVVNESILAIHFEGPESISNSCETLIWDWKSCVVLGRIYSETSNADLAFLDKDHLFALSCLPDSITESRVPSQVALLFYRIPIAAAASPQEPPCTDFFAPSYPKLQPVLILEFPKVHQTYQLQGYILASVPLLGELAYRGPTSVIHSHTTTIGLQLWVERIEEYEAMQNLNRIELCIFVNTNRIFDYLSENKKQEVVRKPWTQWGTAATRWFIDSDSLSASSTVAFGSLYPIWDLDNHRADQRLSIFEFNPQIVQRYLYAGASGGIAKKKSLERRNLSPVRTLSMADLKLPLMSVYDTDAGEDVITNVIGSDEKTVINVGFEEPVESRLPYMVVTRVRHMPRHQEWYILGDYLVGIPIMESNGSLLPLSLYRLQPSHGDLRCPPDVFIPPSVQLSA